MSLYLPNLILPPDEHQDLVLCISHDGTVRDPYGNQIQTTAYQLPAHGELIDRKKQNGGDNKPAGLFECFHCLSRSVAWDSIFDFSDFGYEGDGIVQLLHCLDCGAEIEYRVRIDQERRSE